MAQRTRFKGQWVRIMAGSSEYPLEVKVLRLVSEAGESMYECELEDGSSFFLASNEVSWVFPMKKPLLSLVESKVQSLKDFRQKRSIK